AAMAIDPASVGPGRGGYFLVGPNAPFDNTRNNSICVNAPDNVPAATPWHQTPGMRYTVKFTNGNANPFTVVPGGQPADELTPPNPNGLTLALRRLTNPHRPPDSNPTTGPPGNEQPNPNYNPYITVDYMEKVKPNDATTAP